MGHLSVAPSLMGICRHLVADSGSAEVSDFIKCFTKTSEKLSLNLPHSFSFFFLKIIEQTRYNVLISMV